VQALVVVGGDEQALLDRRHVKHRHLQRISILGFRVQGSGFRV